jgi:mannosyl-3-phosphoglycerate synthase
MKIDFPSYTERLGSVSIHAVQRVHEIDSGKSTGYHSSHKTIRQFDYNEILNVMNDLAIVIPIKNEKLKLLEGVLSGIPNDCLIIIVSNSPRSPVDKFATEVETSRQLARFMDKKLVIIHQQDKGLAEVFKKVGYHSILDNNGNVREGKAEAMVIGMLIAKMYHRGYVGFIDGDNYIPGAVNEYVKIFASGFCMSTSPYCNVRVSWVFKPKIKDSSLYFAKWGRISEVTNKYLNTLLSHISGFETEVIKTANSGEHALSMPLAECLHFSSGYSVEPYEFLDILEKFGGLLPSEYPEIMEKGIEIFQIEPRNPHFHEDKGSAHLKEMLGESLISLYRSKICPSPLSQEIRNQIEKLRPLSTNDEASEKKPRRRKSSLDNLEKYPLMDPIIAIPITTFAKELKEVAATFSRYGSL